MRAALFRQHGGPEVLEIADVPVPEPGAGEVQVRVVAAALNHLDIWIRRGLPALKIALPHISGGDVAGYVSALGPGVQGVRIGERVVLNPGISCGRCRVCLTGRDHFCPSFRMLGEHTLGGFAEFVVVPAANLVPAPSDRVPVATTDLAALPVTFITSWQMLVGRAAVRRGETVLVLGAGSGVGVAAIQIAKLFGARVIAAASGEKKLAAARELGADHTVDLTRDELVPAVKALTDRRGADIVFEHTGAATFPSSVVIAARGGRIVTCGATAGYETPLNLRHVFFRQLSILGSTLGPKSVLFEVVERVAAGELRPVIDRVIPLEEVADAHRALENREVFGKIVVALGSDATT